MEKRTSEIIMTLKGHHEFGERDTYKQLLAAYMSDRCNYPESQYADEMLFGIVKEAVKDYMSGLTSPGQIRAFLYDYFEAHKWHEDEIGQWLVALAGVQVKEKVSEDSYRYINGFNDENTAFVHKSCHYEASASKLKSDKPPRCDKCVSEIDCTRTHRVFECESFKRDAPDGGYYG